MEPQPLRFTVERETKNTVRYQEDTEGKPPAIGTLYIQKGCLVRPRRRRWSLSCERTPSGTGRGLVPRRAEENLALAFASSIRPSCAAVRVRA